MLTALSTGRSWPDGAQAAPGSSEGIFSNCYYPPARLAIIGAVHIARFLAPMARLARYSCGIIDPRRAFASAIQVSDLTVDTRWPDEALPEWKLDGSCAVVTLSHDPKIDDPALRCAVASPAFYIGALGSRRTHLARLDRLAMQGLSNSALKRIRGPAGLDIGAANPAEIALPVLADMTSVWRKRAR